MNPFFLIGGILLILLGLIHTILGEKLIIIPVLKREMPQLLGSDFLMRRTLRFAWHITTVAFGGMAAILIYYGTHASLRADPVVLYSIAISNVVSGIISLTIAHGKHFSWWVFFLVGLVVWWGMRVVA